MIVLINVALDVAHELAHETVVVNLGSDRWPRVIHPDVTRVQRSAKFCVYRS